MSSKKNKVDVAGTNKPELAKASQEKNDKVTHEQRKADREFAELVEQADAIDQVMTRKGPPEDDWNSG